MIEALNWTLFTGTWRTADKRVEEDVREAVREVIKRGKGVLTGGATGVDYFAMDEALIINPDALQLKVIIPTHLEGYIADYYKNWCQEPITRDEIDKLAAILMRLKIIKPSNLIEMPNKNITQEHYDLRSMQEVLSCGEVYAFHVNNSSGTQKTVDYATRMGKQIALYKRYHI